jgi:signal transduction histidine kinase
MSVRTRLVTTYLSIILVLSLPGIFAATRLGRLRQLAVEGRSGQAGAVSSLGTMQALMAQLDRLERSFIATGDSELGREAQATSDSLRQVYDRFVGSPYGYLGHGLEPLVGDVQAVTGAVGLQVRQGSDEAAAGGLEQMLTDFDATEDQLGAMADSIDAVAQRDLQQAESLSRSARMQTLIGILIAMILTGALAGVVTQVLTNPLRRLSRAMAHVADGELEAPAELPYERRDEIGDLSCSFRIMTRRLAELDRTKSEFLGMVSHELKTPINVISAYAELIEDELTNDVVDSHRRLLASVREQAFVMAKRVSRLMDLSRLEAGSFLIEPEPVPTQDLIADLDRSFGHLADERQIRLRTGVSPEAPKSIVIDVDVIRDEVLGNLIVNALRFSPPGGCVDVVADADEGGVVFSVTDSGPGIPDEHRAFVFQKHYVADRTRAMGSGLGLAIAKAMVELHGGLIWLEPPAPGRGACFKVALPGTPPLDGLELPNGALTEATPSSEVELVQA